VQIIESTPFGVRSSIMVLERPDDPVRFVLFPMLHLASPTFYEEITRRLQQCDLVLAEGISGPQTSLITLSYRIAGKIRRFGFVEQGRALRLRALGVRVENVDATASQFKHSWQRVPRYMRLLAMVLSPLFGLWLIISGSRQYIAREMEVNDLPDADDAFMPESFASLENAMVRDRDRLLCAAIARHASNPTPDATTIAIVWGAGHIPAVVRYMVGPLRYHVVQAEWVTVFVP
jgi:hypothetical protein